MYNIINWPWFILVYPVQFQLQFSFVYQLVQVKAYYYYNTTLFLLTVNTQPSKYSQWSVYWHCVSFFSALLMYSAILKEVIIYNYYLLLFYNYVIIITLSINNIVFIRKIVRPRIFTELKVLTISKFIKKTLILWSV